MATYIALLFKDPGSDYGVAFPDFPGCVTAGATQEEARQLAAEVLAFHVDGMRASAEPIPEPSTLDAIMADSENRARCAARAFSASSMPRTRRTTARAVRPAASSLPIARFP